MKNKSLYFSRYVWLLDIINENPGITLEDIINKYDQLCYIKNLDNEIKPFSKRTFFRDLAEMKELFGVQIEYKRASKGYYFQGSDLDANTQSLIDSYRYIHISHRYEGLNKYVVTEPNITGQKYLYDILDAIEKRKRIKFNYKKYVTAHSEQKTVEPYFLKEFKRRWYVVALDKYDKKVKTFALERIETTPIAADGEACYDILEDISLKTYFQNSFGIFKMPDLQAEDIILSFTPLKGKFLKAQSLHPSQEVIVENETECRIKLNLQITPDFIMEILSHGCEVKVISPEILVKEVCSNLERALKQYNY